MSKAPAPLFFSLVTAVLLALCIGAIWPVAQLIASSDAPWMALVAAAVAVFAVASVGLGTAATRALLAAALTALSIAYAQYLSASAVVTGMLGISFRSVVAMIGPEMAFAL